MNAAPASSPELPWRRDFVALAAIWGSSFLFMRLAVAEWGPLATAGMRVAIAAAFLLPLLLWRRQAPLLRPHAWPLVVVGTLNSVLPFVLYAFALQSLSTGLSAMLNATTPMFGALVAWLWLDERLNRWRVLGLVLGFVGVGLLAWEQARFKAGGLAALWAVLACLGACVSYGISASYGRKHLAQVPSLVVAAGSQIGAALVLALPTAWAWPAQRPSATAWLAVLAVGVLCTGLAYLMFYRVLQRAGAARSLSVTYLIPLFALVYGVLLLGEQLSAAMLLGGAVILLGTALSVGALPRPGSTGSPLKGSGQGAR